MAEETNNIPGASESNTPISQPEESAPEIGPTEMPIPAEVPIAPEQDGSITIPAADWQVVMSRLATLENENRIRTLVDDKNTSNKIEELRRAGKLVKSVKVRQVNGRFVRAWKTVKDEVYKDQEGKLIENQIVGLYLMEEEGDDTYIEMNLRQWAVVPAYIPCEITRESRESNGELYFTVRTNDGLEFQIGSTYVN